MQSMLFKHFSWRFVIIAIFILAIAVSSTHTQGAHPISLAAETHLLGRGQTCDFFNGVGVGLGVATLFGCAVCGAASLIIAVGSIIAC